MKSTGNDIVALNAIDIERTISPAFYSKFITVAEQALSRQPQIEAISFENFVWLLWSVKESAYKYLKRSQPDLIFPPAKIIIQKIVVPNALLSPDATHDIWESSNSTEDLYAGEVTFKSYHLYFRSKITTAFIASVVADSFDFNAVYWGVKQIEAVDQESQSREVRVFALEKLKATLNNNDLLIEKNMNGCPILFSGGESLPIPVSLAHHHNFVAYSFLSQL